MACVVDDDCAVAHLCYPANASWNEEGVAFCACNSFYGWTGDDCLTLGPLSVVQLINTLLQVGLSMAVVAVLGRDLFDYWRAFDGRLQLNASVQTVLYIWAGAICIFLWRFLFVLGIVLPSANDRVLQGDDQPASAFSFYALSRPFNVGQEVFLFASILTISVVWVEVAAASRSLNARLVDNVARYRRVVIGLELFFATCMLIIGGFGRFELSGVVATPFIIGLIIMLVIGRRRMVSLLHDALRSNALSASDSHSDSFPDRTDAARAGSSDEGSSKEQRRRMRRAMLAIERTARRLIIGLIVLVVGSAAYFVVNDIPEAGWREFAEPGGFPGAQISAAVIPWVLLSLYVVCAVYAHRNAKKLIRSKLGQSTSSVGTASKNFDTDVPSTIRDTPSAINDFTGTL